MTVSQVAAYILWTNFSQFFKRFHVQVLFFIQTPLVQFQKELKINCQKQANSLDLQKLHIYPSICSFSPSRS